MSVTSARDWQRAAERRQSDRSPLWVTGVLDLTGLRKRADQLHSRKGNQCPKSVNDLQARLSVT
jgi:hypothetical protein